jgi:Fe-S oxidoreductase
MATGDERNTTRARANILREFLGKPDSNPWDHPEIYEILDLCLSCKGCKSECPSNVDIAKIKAEFLQHWYDRHGIPFRTYAIAWISSLNRIGSLLPSFFNFFASNPFSSKALKRILGFAQKRSIPLLYKTSLRKWIKRNRELLIPSSPKGRICLFIDEFTDYNDTETGIKAIKLLNSLGYEIITVHHDISARTFISKGLLRRAARIARRNIEILSPVISERVPLIGIEPSALLGFRDEYPDLAGPGLQEKAKKIAENSFLFDEFITREFNEGRISKNDFNVTEKEILVHVHCQQKSVAGSASLITALSIPAGFKVREIPSGCCGMAGSFGYEKEHFELSNKIGELILFPEIRKANNNSIIVAPGTSCRHHVKDGTGKLAVHPVDVLYEILKR